MQLRDRDIVLNYESRIKLKIGDMDIFPGGFERLRLWDTPIVLARHIVLNKNIFEGK